MHCETLHLKISPARISLLRFLLEGYDGLAVLTTLDRKTGLVRLLFPAARYHELIALLRAISEELRNANQNK
jgi:hypothetical protein